MTTQKTGKSVRCAYPIRKQGFSVVRYADDAMIFEKILADELKLTMYPKKTKNVPFNEGFCFLGFDFWKEPMVLPEKRVRKFPEMGT